MKLVLKKINQTQHSSLTDYGYLIVRVCFGLLLLKHGYPKITQFEKYVQHFSDPLGVGVQTSLLLVIFAEVICALFIALGLLTRLAAIPVVINFIIIFFVVHGNDSFGDRELAAVYLMLASGILLMGSGKISVDRKLGF